MDVREKQVRALSRAFRVPVEMVDARYESTRWERVLIRWGSFVRWVLG